jgi:hippurate hydrolase
VVTVGSFQAGTKHNVIADEARLLLTVRSYSDETRKHLIEGIERIARGEAIAAGIPEDRMPQVHVKDEYTPATWNVPGFTRRMADLFEARFGKDRVMQAPPAMGGEDFGRYWRADPSIESLIFWVGGVPRAQWDAAQASGAPLPSLHSPLWLPDADAVIATAAEALSASALSILAK